MWSRMNKTFLGKYGLIIWPAMMPAPTARTVLYSTFLSAMKWTAAPNKTSGRRSGKALYDYTKTTVSRARLFQSRFIIKWKAIS